MGTVNRAEVVDALRVAQLALIKKADVFFYAHATHSANRCSIVAEALSALRGEVMAWADSERLPFVFDDAHKAARRDAAAFRKLGAAADAHTCDAIARAVVEIANSLGIEMETEPAHE